MTYSDSLVKNALAEKIAVIKNAENYCMTIHPSDQRKDAVGVVMSEKEFLSLKKQIDCALRKPALLTDKNVEKMEQFFLSAKTHEISFQYRKQSFKDDKPVLAKLLADGKIVQVEKTAKKILYRYVDRRRPGGA